LNQRYNPDLIQGNILKKIISESEDATRKLGSEFAKKLGGTDIAAFYGELGSGKTQFIKGICSELGVKDVVNSPTFVIVNEYNYSNGKKIFHFDLYRMKSTEEVIELGFEDYFDKGLILIEWPELIEKLLPDNIHKIRLSHYGNDSNTRLIEMPED
jgi:tRNA threonylcarbamoyladenosine biosynthesis protein TsaE